MKTWKKPGVESVSKLELSNYIAVSAKSGAHCAGWFSR